MKIKLDKKARLIITVSIIVIIAGIITWQIYSYLSSQNSIIVSDPIEGSETITKSSPGEPLKNATKEVKENISPILS
jgi:hypothetical protein